MSIGLIYMMLAAIVVQTIVHSARVYFDKIEELRFSEERILFVTPNWLSLSIVPFFIFFWSGWFLSDILLSAPFFLVSITTIIALVVGFFYCRLHFMWLHFFEDKVFISCPLKGLFYQIALSGISDAGKKQFGRTYYHFIRFKTNEEQSILKIYGIITQEDSFKKYFGDRDIQFQDI